MTKKHFEAIAAAFAAQQKMIDYHKEQGDMKDMEAGWARDSLRKVATSMAGTFAADNPRFDTQRFLRACGF